MYRNGGLPSFSPLDIKQIVSYSIFSIKQQNYSLEVIVSPWINSLLDNYRSSKLIFSILNQPQITPAPRWRWISRRYLSTCSSSSSSSSTSAPGNLHLSSCT
jgi:hypothetical protein